MRTYDEYRLILELWEEHRNQHEVARLTGIPLTTVNRYVRRYQTVERFEAEFDAVPQVPTLSRLKTESPENATLREQYAYLLGLYLGDGHISKTKSHRAHRLSIALDAKYPGIIERCQTAIETVFPGNKVGFVKKHDGRCILVNCYSQTLPALFPQHGDGKKHERTIQLEPWQQFIVDQYPLEFLRGLYHSDGARSRNVVNGKDYPRYFFANFSEDILKLFTDTAEKLGLRWRQTNRRNVAISRREDVAWLDTHIGAKE